MLAELQGAGLPPRGYVFTRVDGRPGPPSAKRVSDQINVHLRTVGVPGTAHKMRHRFETKLYGATHDLMLVAAVMGHSSTETAMGYVKVSPS